MDATGHPVKRSSRLWIKQVTDPSNKLQVYNWQVYLPLRGDVIRVFATIEYENEEFTRLLTETYRETRSGYLILDPGIRPHRNSTQTDRDARVITWYTFQDKIYRKTKAGEVTVEEDLHLLGYDIHSRPRYRLKQNKDLEGCIAERTRKRKPTRT